MIFAIILLVALAGSMLTNVSLFFGNLFEVSGGSRRDVEPRLQEVVLQNNSSHNKIAVVDVDGIISSSAGRGGYDMVETLKAQFKQAQKDDKVKAVLMRVDSPGGEVLASDEIYKIVSDFQERSGKPVIAQMNSMAASGGYYVSAGARWIVANELTITGSIGVIMSGWNYRGLMDKVGIVPRVFKSGKYKDMLSGSRRPEEITPKEDEMVQSLIDEVFGKFKEVVSEGRGRATKSNGKDGRKLVSDWREYADGRVFSGTEAFRLGFVDELGDFNTSVKRTLKLAQVDDANLVQYQQIVDLADIFSLLGQGTESRVKVDLGFDPPKLQAGKLYFMSSTLVQ